MTDNNLIMLEGYDGLGFSIKKAVKKVTSAVSDAAQAAANAAAAAVQQAQQAAAAAAQAAQARLDEVKQVALSRVQEAVNQVQSQVQQLQNDLVSQVSERFGDAVSDVMSNRVVAQLQSNLKKPEYIAAVLASVAERSNIPVISGLGETYLEVYTMRQQGLGWDEIITQLPAAQQLASDPNAQALIQLAQNPTAAQLQQCIAMATSEDTVRALQEAYDVSRTTLSSMFDDIVASAFSIFDYVDQGKLV